MFKLAVVFLFTTVVLAQDLDSILLDIYGPDMNTNMIHKNSEEVTGGANTDYKQPIPIKYQHMKRQATQDNVSCTVGKLMGRCVPYYLCSEVSKDIISNNGENACENSIEICCPSRN